MNIPKPQSGFVLILVLFVMVMMTVLGLMSLSSMSVRMRTAANYRSKTQAFYQAEGQLNRSKHRIVKGFVDAKDPRFVAFDPLDPQGVFKDYVDDRYRGLARYLKTPGRQTSLFFEGQGLGTVDYKVIIRKISDISSNDAIGQGTMKLDNTLRGPQFRFGRSVELESTAEHKSGSASQLKQQIVLSYLPNVIFRYGMLTNRLKECQFCHMHVKGDLGQVGGEHFQPISPHVTMGVIDGNLLLSGDFRLDQHPAHQQLLEISGKIVENTRDPRLMPLTWPSLLDRTKPESPKMAGFYSDLVDRAYLKGDSVVRGGEIRIQRRRQDNFSEESLLRGVTDGNVILEGTEENPLEIRGPLVIKGDLIIQGFIKGTGSLYVERNIYIVGDIRYVNRPSYEEWDNMMEAEWLKKRKGGRDALSNFDKLGLFAGGNVVLGNLAHKTVFRYLQYFLNYESSGMVPQSGSSRKRLPGEFTVYDPLGVYSMDGGQGRRNTIIRSFRFNDPFEDGSDYDKDGSREWGEGMRWLKKEAAVVDSTGLLPAGAGQEDFAGGWISREAFSEIATKTAETESEKINAVTEIDATIYTDGAFTGYKPSNDGGKTEKEEYKSFGDIDGDGLTFNGAVISRDVDVLAPGGWYIRYDNRNYVGEGAAVNFEPSRLVEISGWRESK